MCFAVATVVVTGPVTCARLAGAQPNTVFTKTYYVSCRGSDRNNGTGMSTPWATIPKVSRERYAPGDEILFQRGCVWTGTVAPRSSGTDHHPIVISAYGSGATPRIVGHAAPALQLRNVSDWSIEDLDLTQVGQRPQPLARGNLTGKDVDPDADRVMRAVVDIRALGPHGNEDCGSRCRARNITLTHLVVHDGQWDGIYIGAGYQSAADEVFGSIDGVTVRDVEARNNQSGGIVVAGTFTKDIRYEVSNVQILDSLMYGNGGNGMVLGQVDHGLIQGNRCAYNGSIRNASIGCWSWDSKDITIQFNEADHNTNPPNVKPFVDGGGFDLDMGSVDSVMQYNWSHDNDGEGFLLESWPIGYGYKCCVSRDVTMRFNISENDGKTDSGGIEIYGGVRSAWIYNNTVSYVAARQAVGIQGTGGDLTSITDGGRAGSPEVHVANNVFISNGAAVGPQNDPLVTTDGRGTFHFDHNLWFRTEGGVEFAWGKSRLDNWSEWTAKGFDVHGNNVDPWLKGPVGSGPIGDEPRPGSPIIGAGAPLPQSPKGIGGRDYFGSEVPQGNRNDVGAIVFPGPHVSRNSNAAPVVHAIFTRALHVASFATSCSNGGGKALVHNGSVAQWCAHLVEDDGSPAAGETVTTAIYSPSWDSITATVQARTNSEGIALFRFRIGGKDPRGIYFLFVSQVLVPPPVYYDSYQNGATTLSLTLK
jgi:hypothetical protein